MSCCNCECAQRLVDEMTRNKNLQQRCHEQELLAQRQVEIVQSLVNQVKRQRLEEELFGRLDRSERASQVLADALLGDDDDRRLGIITMMRDLHDEYLGRLVKKSDKRSTKSKAKK